MLKRVVMVKPVTVATKTISNMRRVQKANTRTNNTKAFTTKKVAINQLGTTVAPTTILTKRKPKAPKGRHSNSPTVTRRAPKQPASTMSTTKMNIRRITVSTMNRIVMVILTNMAILKAIKRMHRVVSLRVDTRTTDSKINNTLLKDSLTKDGFLIMWPALRLPKARIPIITTKMNTRKNKHNKTNKMMDMNRLINCCTSFYALVIRELFSKLNRLQIVE